MVFAKTQRAVSRTVCVTLLACAVAFFPLRDAQALIVPQSTAASSGAGTTDDARVDPAVCGAMQDIADGTVRVGDQARAAGIITEPEPTAGLTCMDQSITLTARTAAKFSDKHDKAVPPPNTVVFKPKLAYPNWGADDFLLKNLDRSIRPMLDNYLGSNFGGVLGAALGTGRTSARLTDLLSGVTGPIDKITSQVDGFNQQINGILSAIETIQTLSKALKLPMPSPVIIGVVTALEGAQRVAHEMMGQVQGAMNRAVQPLVEDVMAEIMSPAADMDCDNIDRLLNGAEDEPNMRSVRGRGSHIDTPFMSVSRLLSGGSLSRVGGGMMDQLQVNENIDILQRALNHLTDGVLSGPGKTPSWRTAPIIPVTAGTREVVNYMQGGQD